MNKKLNEEMRNYQSQIKAMVQEVAIQIKTDIMEKFENNCHLLHQKRTMLNPVVYQRKLKYVAEVDLNEIQSKFEQLEAE